MTTESAVLPAPVGTARGRSSILFAVGLGLAAILTGIATFFAVSGAGPIAAVDVRVDDGDWQPARLVGDRHPHRWQWWELLTRIDRPGATEIRARATDDAGRTQPDEVAWNRLGYGGNAIQVVQATVR